MRRHLFAVACLVAWLSAAAQAGFVINSFRFASTGPASISFVGCTGTNNPATSTLYSFSAHDTGIADPSRGTIIGVRGTDNALDFSISAVSLGGNAAAEVVESANASSETQSGLYIIANPTGTNGDINVTFSEEIQNAGVCVWAAYDLTSLTATDTAAAFHTSSASLDLSLDVATDGVGVGISSVVQNGDSVTWGGFAERSETSVSDGGNSSTFSGADTSTAGTPLTVSADWAGSGDAIGVSASFR